MCLYVNTIKTKEELCNKNDRTFYKVYIKEEDKLYTLYQKQGIPSFGVYEHSVCEYDRHQTINYGVYHARTDKHFHYDIAWFNMFYRSNYELVYIEIKVKCDDIIAFGVMDDVCFTKYEITEYAWNNMKNVTEEVLEKEPIGNSIGNSDVIIIGKTRAKR